MKQPEKKPSPAPVVIASPVNQVAAIQLIRHVAVMDPRGMEELTDRLRLGQGAASHGDKVTSIEMCNPYMAAFATFRVVVGANQVIYVPASNVASYRMVA